MPDEASHLDWSSQNELGRQDAAAILSQAREEGCTLPLFAKLRAIGTERVFDGRTCGFLQAISEAALA